MEYPYLDYRRALGVGELELQGYMTQAVQLGQSALVDGFSPFGALIVDVQSGGIISQAASRAGGDFGAPGVGSMHDHAEQRAFDQALRVLKDEVEDPASELLANGLLVVNADPCIQCLADTLKHVERFATGAHYEPGDRVQPAVSSMIYENATSVQFCIRGILEARCSEHLKTARKARRTKNPYERNYLLDQAAAQAEAMEAVADNPPSDEKRWFCYTRDPIWPWLFKDVLQLGDVDIAIAMSEPMEELLLNRADYPGDEYDFLHTRTSEEVLRVAQIYDELPDDVHGPWYRGVLQALRTPPHYANRCNCHL